MNQQKKREYQFNGMVDGKKNYFYYYGSLCR